MNIIHVNQVRKQYQNHLALNDVSFDIEKGSIFGLLGPNGAGKTTFIRILTMITAPDSGYILFNNEKLDSHNIADIGYLPEERGLYKKMKVGEQALYLARLKGLDRDTAMTELKKWFIKFDITSWWDKKVEELSKGMAQKIQFITTIIHHPKVLIFDEPFSGFDPVNTSVLKQEIINQRNNGATIVFSTHNMESV
ncbi:MAG: ATP-binding cassette domain-containing protein, partial [Bacteroidales bacterium]|nr:ATP-binding cassette domain-containing protein [Bacteroidales bacterium]